jgi:hypothetical protein
MHATKVDYAMTGMDAWFMFTANPLNGHVIKTHGIKRSVELYAQNEMPA